MKKLLAILGGIVVGAAAIAGTVYAVLYFQKKQREREEDCYIDDDCICGCGGDDYEDYLDDAEEALEDVVDDVVDAVEETVEDVADAASDLAEDEE